MNDQDLHNNNEQREDPFFSKGKIAWEKTEADVWNELQNNISNEPKGRSVSLNSRILQITSAAVFLLLLGLGGVTFLYTKTVRSVAGEKIVAELPDGSRVELNASSSVSYYPLKWRFERKLKFEGEAFFEVEKGKKFEVESRHGNTKVLGTSFNIFARDSNYRVTCLTGKVQVSASPKESVFLTPNEHVELKDGKLVMKKDYKAQRAISWKNNHFDFAGRPLKEVIDEIERQYAIKIKLQKELFNRSFVGNFSKTDSVEQVLDFVCKSMQLKFEKKSENVFLVVKNS